MFCDFVVVVLVLRYVLLFCDPLDYSPQWLLCPWDFPGKNNGEDHHFSFQGIFSIQGLNLHLLHCRQILYHLVNREANFVTSSNLSPKCMLDYIYFSAPVLLAQPCSKPFSAPNSDAPVCLASLCLGHMNLCSVTVPYIK